MFFIVFQAVSEGFQGLGASAEAKSTEDRSAGLFATGGALKARGLGHAEAPAVESLEAICARLEREEAEDALQRGCT